MIDEPITNAVCAAMPWLMVVFAVVVAVGGL